MRDLDAELTRIREPHPADQERIGRVLRLLETLWRAHSEMPLGELLEHVASTRRERLRNDGSMLLGADLLAGLRDAELVAEMQREIEEQGLST